MEAELKRQLDRIHRQLNELIAEKQKATWITSSWLMEITGWSKRKLQSAREQGIVEYKKGNNGGTLYKLESLPDIFIIKKQAS
jgi:hypothetical protein